MKIRYIRTLNGNFIVSLTGTNQRIVVLPGVMSRVINPPVRKDLGSYKVTPEEAAELGFLPYGYHPQIQEVSERDLVGA